MKLHGKAKQRRENRLLRVKCLQCGKQLQVFRNRKGINYCSEECRKLRTKAKAKFRTYSEKERLGAFKSITFKQWKAKPDEFLILRYKQTLIKLELIEKIMGERESKQNAIYVKGQ